MAVGKASKYKRKKTIAGSYRTALHRAGENTKLMSDKHVAKLGHYSLLCSSPKAQNRDEPRCRHAHTGTHTQTHPS